MFLDSISMQASERGGTGVEPIGDLGRCRAGRLSETARLGFPPPRNVFAETPDGDASNVVMVGAHLDSVPATPPPEDRPAPQH